jgi:hypothetical protein
MPAHHIRHSAVTSAPPSAVYALLADIDTWTDWGTWEKTELESTAPDGTGGVGAIRRLYSRSFGSVIVSRERVAEAVPDKRIAYELLEGLPLVGYRGVVELEPHGQGTKITWSSSFDGQTWFGGWFYRLFLGAFIWWTVRAVGRAAAKPVARVERHA